MRFLQSIRSFFGIPDAKQPEPPAGPTYCVQLFYANSGTASLADASLDNAIDFLLGGFHGKIQNINHRHLIWADPKQLWGWRLEPALSVEELSQHPRAKELVAAISLVSERTVSTSR